MQSNSNKKHRRFVNSRRTRLAPSPTGALHLGNIFSFLITWAIAKQHNWEVLLRIEDIDGPRKKTGAETEMLEIFKWIGLHWDGDAHIQSSGFNSMRCTLDSLIEQNLAYHCTLTRKEIEDSRSAPHELKNQSMPHYRPHHIHKHNAEKNKQPTNWRFTSSLQTEHIKDELLGIKPFEPSDDFVLWTKDDAPSYQLAVVCDDHTQKVTDVIRGNDLLQSASWQEQLYRAMGWEPPNWYHLPLIIGNDGKRLAKRHGDSRISTFRNQNVAPERIIGLMAKWAGNRKPLTSLTSQDFLQDFDLKNIPTENIVYTPEEEQWLYD